MAKALSVYNRKRNFNKTPEPEGRPTRAHGHGFVVQKHAARQLHYDFRLELDASLKSWAVAKGPSLVAGEKRLAVPVEDHPLSYADFEGVIPQGEYGAGTVMLWDKGIWKPEGDPLQGYAKGGLAFTLEGEKLKGRWRLVRMRARPGERRQNWLLIKSKDRDARTPKAPDILEEAPLSVATGRSMAQIADRTQDRVTSKRVHRQDFIVAGFVPSTTRPKTIASLVLAYWDHGRLLHAGRVGAGFSKSSAADLFGDLERDLIARPAFLERLGARAQRNVKWVRLRKVAEVEFQGWTSEGRVRLASFNGLRSDKDARKIIREEAIARPVDRRTDPPSDVQLTHPDRMLWPRAGVTKRKLADYYAAVWPRMERFVTNRPLVVVRCPTGLDHGCFFQRHGWEGMSEHVRQIRDRRDDEPILAIDDFDGLIALVQASVLEIHSWGARADNLERPDMLTIDLDPGAGVVWDDLVLAAHDARDRLRERGYESFVKTSGGKGFHVVVPLKPHASWDAAKTFCKSLAEEMARENPTRYVATALKSKRTKRIYVDYLRNARGATAVAPYSTRARPKCAVSAPLFWEELESLASADDIHLSALPERLARQSADPWARFFALDQQLADKA